MKHRVAMSLDSDLLAKLDVVAAELRRTRTSLVEDAIAEYLGGRKVDALRQASQNWDASQETKA